MTNLDKVANSYNCNYYYYYFFFFGGGGVWWCFFVTMRKQFAENANKSYHVYKVKVVLYIYNKIFGIRLEGLPANKNKSLILSKF